jgi:hypothetical protein
MSVELPSHDGAADRAAVRVLDLAAAALALAHVANEALSESASGTPEGLISGIETATEQLVVALDGLPGCGVNSAARRPRSRGSSTLVDDLRNDTRAELNPT